MQDAWLLIDRLWSAALGGWPVQVGAALLWAVLMVTAAQRPQARWADSLPLALGAGVAAALGFEFGFGWAAAPLPDLRTVAGGFGVAAAVFAWPLLAMRPQTRSSSVARTA